MRFICSVLQARWQRRTAVRVRIEVAVSDRLAVGVIGAVAALSAWRLGRQTELLADGGYLAAPAR